MPDALSFADLEGQHVELLPPRTVLSLFVISAKRPKMCDQYGNCYSGDGNQINSTGPDGFNIGNETDGGTQTNTAGVGSPGAQG
ncbi:MAG: hypothetical protein M3228_03500 [Actinomycetota bacterium]|nr:hypothetical protein [Actinomycetota bacterium]